jgi:arylsulfatase
MSQSNGQTRRAFLGQAASMAAALSLPAWARRPPDGRPRRQPNIVIIFSDDQGYGDVGVYGARGFSTPHLDHMASEGVRLTDFYVSQPVCSASRASLLTGCYANRVGVAGAYGPHAKKGLHPRETTIAELCKARGYATAMFGKWHLGHRPPFLPTRHGFDEFCGTPYSNDMWPLHPDLVKLPPDAEERKRRYPDLPLYEGEKVVDPKITAADQARFTTQFTKRAVDFIERHRSRPFFLYLAHPMPHVPLFVSERFKGKSEQGLYGDVISEIDWSVGQVLDALKRCRVDDDTLVIFTSDNGPWLSYGNHAGSAGPLREGKGTTWEGGVRVPCLARWPGKIPAGLVCREPAMTIDVLPTVAGLIGASLPALKIDGRDIWPLLSGVPGAKSPHDVLYFYYHDNHLEALRSGNWKLVFPHTYRSLTGEPGADGFPDGYTYPKCGLELYDLTADIGERHNVMDEHPEVVARLQVLAEAAREDLGDALSGRKGRNRRAIGHV